MWLEPVLHERASAVLGRATKPRRTVASVISNVFIFLLFLVFAYFDDSNMWFIQKMQKKINYSS